MKPLPDRHKELIESFLCADGIYTNQQLLDWIKSENEITKAVLQKTKISDDSFWHYDEKESEVLNRNHSFFTLKGIRRGEKEQPIILQNEVGYLGFIGKKINGVLHFLMQAKIEPGNVNNVQISPTIQATKSNFTQRHGGRAPYYLDYFKGADRYEVVYDGDEPEQCSRFYKKYNRNVIILLPDDEEIEVLDHFRWMTIGQIKWMANNCDNLVNMDTRTVLSCIPYYHGTKPHSSPFFDSVFDEDDSAAMLRLLIEHQKTIGKAELLRLDSLSDWERNDQGIFCKHQYPFSFQYFDIAIEDREVTHWTQPLAVANGKALFALGYVLIDSHQCYLIKMADEIGCEFGSCFGPTVQFEAPFGKADFADPVQHAIWQAIETGETDVDVVLSEEGGRFYHEENRNVVCPLRLTMSLEELAALGYYAVSYKTIRELIAKSHMVNIQLRNLLSLLRDSYEKK